MEDKIRMFINNEEVVSSNEFTINEEMLSASSTILNNCYPKDWELTKDYISNFYYPEDYSKLIIGKGNYEYGDTEYSILSTTSDNSNLEYETNVEKEWNKLEILGNSYQETRSGKNLLHINNTFTSNGVTMTNNGDGTITLNGTATANFDFWIANGGNSSDETYKYTFTTGTSFTQRRNIISGTSSGDFTLRTLLYDTDTSFLNWGLIRNDSTYTTTFNGNTRATQFYVLSGTTFNNLRMFPQLEIGTTATTPEQYGVMPSPDYPSEIQNVGYQNIFNKGATFNNASAVKSEIDTGVRITETTAGTYKYAVLELGRSNLLGKTITISSNVSVSGQNVAGIYLYWGNSSNLAYQYYYGTQNSGEIEITRTIPTAMPSGADRLNLLLYANTNGTANVNDYVDYENFQIEFSDTKHSYIPYGKYGIEVKNISKNLFNNDTIQLGIAWNNATNTARAINIIPVKPSTDYTISFNSISGLEGVYAFGRENPNDSTRTMGNLDITGTRTITTTANTHYLGLQFNKTSITKEDIINCLFQVEEGNQKTTYEPYKENTQLYVLDSPLRAIKDYKDTMQIENNVMTITRRIKHIELVIANMNNSDEYPGWTNIPETAELKVNYPSKNTTFYGAGIGYNSNIRIQNPTSDYFALNTNGAGVIFLPRGANNSLTQTQWKTNYPNLIVELDYVLPTTTTEEIEGIKLPTSYEGQNYASIYSNVNTRTTIFYNWKNYDVLFSGVIKNSGEISLNPREPHYCSLQVLDYKTFLSECDTLDFVISNKTILEAIQMVVNAVSGYGFILGNININQAEDIIGAYSTLNQSPYDVLQYLANISGSRWRARYVDSSSMAIDFYDPDLLPQADNILYTKQYFEDNNIVNLTFSYGTRDYRNKQIVTSNEVYGDIDYTQNFYADGYTQEFLLEENIGNVKSVYLNGVIQDVITKDEKDNGVDGDFYYTPGKNTISSVKLLSVNNEIVVTYTPLIKGRQIVYNSDEVNRISQQTDTIGIISRYEIRNDIFSNTELNQVGQTYINFKGTAEILLTIQTENEDLFNIGEVSYFDAPINELKQYYMVKSKKINYIVINGVPTLFYEYQLTSSYNNEKAINYFDNQRNKAQGNIQLGQTIVRNIDIENETMIVWQNLEINEIELEINNNNVLNNIFNSPFIE